MVFTLQEAMVQPSTPQKMENDSKVSQWTHFSMSEFDIWARYPAAGAEYVSVMMSTVILASRRAICHRSLPAQP